MIITWLLRTCTVNHRMLAPFLLVSTTVSICRSHEFRLCGADKTRVRLPDWEHFFLMAHAGPGTHTSPDRHGYTARCSWTGDICLYRKLCREFKLFALDHLGKVDCGKWEDSTYCRKSHRTDLFVQDLPGMV